MKNICIPDRKNLHITPGYGDCSGYYYIPVISYFYLKRIWMMINMLDGKNNNVLDAGCGCGILFYELKKTFSKLYGIDLRKDIAMVKKCLEKDNIRASIMNGNICNIPYKDSSFDCVVSMSVLEHIKCLEGPIKEVKRVLKDDGSFVCGFPVRNFLMHSFFKIIGFDDLKSHPSSHGDILEVLGKNFRIEKITIFPSFFKVDASFYIVCRCKK